MLCQQGIVIVGAGIVGLSTAYALLSQGMQHVTVLEQEAVDHRRCSSHGSSRLLRFARTAIETHALHPNRAAYAGRRKR